MNGSNRLSGPGRETEGPRDHAKAARRRAKAEARIRLRAGLSPEPWERFRILSDSIREARQMVDLSDHRARYALIIVGVLNAGVLAVTSRSRSLAELPAGLRPWLVVVMIVYGLLTLAFVLHAIESLRPRPLEAAGPATASEARLLFWDAVSRHDLNQYHGAWDQARMAEIIREAEAMFHALSTVIVMKHRALHRLYMALVALVLLATLLLGLMSWLTVRNP
jgi:hypothetical protein